MPVVEYSNKFLRKLDRLSKQVIEKAQDQERIFRENPFHPRLRTHKLHGKLKDEWVFWIDQKYRIKFVFLDSGSVLFIDIGTHREVY